MSVNEKSYLLKVFLEWGEGRIKENDGRGEFKCDKFDML
jgi:hypothetical protein